MSRAVAALQRRFLAKLEELGAPASVVVAVSGGLDSSVLLHLVRFAGSVGRPVVTAAHFDHRMRAASGADARWVAGVCRAWRVPLRLGRADAPLGSEEAARDARYRFLGEVREEVDADLVLTAHHADDQAETVLFRLFRGAGSRGLSGIPSHRSRWVARPLLDVWRAELEAYAEAALLGWREDPTNVDPRFARNALRTVILPEVERSVAPGARRALVRLADMASEEEAAWESVLPDVMRPLEVTALEGGLSLLRAPFLRLHPAVRMRVLRSLAARIGAGLDHASSRRAARFAEAAASGRAIDLAGSLTFGVDLSRLVLGRPTTPGRELPLSIDDEGPGQGTAVLDGRAVPVVWGRAEAGSGGATLAFDPLALRFPLVVRSRRPGDRIRLEGGTKKVKKVLLERRIPPSERHGIPLLVDAEGEVLWIPGLARAAWGGYSESEGAMRIGIG